MNADYREYLRELRVKLARLKLQAETEFNELTLGFHKGLSSAYTNIFLRIGSNGEDEEAYRQHIEDLVAELVKLALEAKYAWTKTKSAYNKGRLLAFATFLGTMKSKAAIADFNEADIGLKNINPERDFLGLKD